MENDIRRAGRVNNDKGAWYCPNVLVNDAFVVDFFDRAVRLILCTKSEDWAPATEEGTAGCNQ